MARGGEVAGWLAGRQAVSQSLGLPSLQAREQFQRSRKGAETEVGTDLCDTHAARRITHSLAHNIHPPGPAEYRSLPLFPPRLSTPRPKAHPDERQTRTPILSNETDVAIFITYRDYVIPPTVTVSRETREKPSAHILDREITRRGYSRLRLSPRDTHTSYNPELMSPPTTCITL